MGQEHMFDNDSFKNEITSASEAEAAYRYYSNNLTTFRHQLASEGQTYEQVEETIRQCWLNLIESSKKVGYSNDHMARMEKQYSKKK
jgi:hypothetical protein